MGLRSAAALVAVLIVVALIATFIAVHNRPVGGIPAIDPNVKTFRALLVADYQDMDGSWFNCMAIDGPLCTSTALVAPVESLQRWAGHLAAYPTTPAQYKVIAATLRAHLLDAIKDLKAEIAFQEAGDAVGFNLAMQGADYQRAWIDPASFAVEGTYPSAATSYRQAVAIAKRAVFGCIGNTPGPDVLSCNRLQSYEACTSSHRQVCEADAESAQTMIEQSLVDTAENPATNPAYARLQSDLANADAGLLAIHDAIVGGGDTGEWNVAEAAFSGAMRAAAADFGSL